MAIRGILMHKIMNNRNSAATTVLLLLAGKLGPGSKMIFHQAPEANDKDKDVPTSAKRHCHNYDAMNKICHNITYLKNFTCI